MNLTKANISEFDFIYSEIEKNFIPDERRDREDALRLFSEGKYDIYLAFEENENVGFITVWQLGDFIFAEHFVIYEGFRNKGYGARVLLELQRIFPKTVLEAEPPFGEIQKRRLSFYKRCGFFENPGKYMQPAYRKGGEEVPLVIMSYPSLLNNFDETVSLILKKVYSKL